MNPAPDESAIRRTGLINGFSAYLLWGMMPLLFAAAGPTGALELVSHRVIWSLVFCAALLVFTGGFLRTWQVMRSPRTFGLLVLASVLIAINWTTFIYGVETNQLVEISLGYYLNPLISIGLGVVFLGEKLRPLQWTAVGSASDLDRPGRGLPRREAAPPAVDGSGLRHPGRDHRRLRARAHPVSGLHRGSVVRPLRPGEEQGRRPGRSARGHDRREPRSRRPLCRLPHLPRFPGPADVHRLRCLAHRRHHRHRSRHGHPAHPLQCGCTAHPPVVGGHAPVHHPDTPVHPRHHGPRRGDVDAEVDRLLRHLDRCDAAVHRYAPPQSSTLTGRPALSRARAEEEQSREPLTPRPAPWFIS